MNFKSYLEKVFVVESSKAVILDDDLREQHYQAGEDLPPGKNAGDVKVVPQRTEVKVTEVKADTDRHAYALVVAADSGERFGWTSAMNLLGSLANETAGLAPAAWTLEPLGNNMTCVDSNALVRHGAPTFASRGTTIPVRTFVAITEKSVDGMFVSKPDCDRAKRYGVGPGDRLDQGLQPQRRLFRSLFLGVVAG